MGGCGSASNRCISAAPGTTWAEIALEFMPRDVDRQGSDVSAAIAILEQLQRVGIGLSSAESVTAGIYARWLAGQARSGALTDAALAQAAEYNTVAELAAR